MRRRALTLGLLAAITASCELAEVATPAGADVLVVEAILRAGGRRQFVLLHHTLEGRVIRGEPNATVSLTTPEGATLVFNTIPLESCLVASPDRWDIDDLDVRATCYASPVDAGRFVRTGATYDLLVETADGRRARGRTRVPSDFRMIGPAVQVDSATRVARCELPTHPFTLEWTQADGAWGYISTLWLTGWGDDLRALGVEVPDPLELTGVSVSASDTTISFPGNLGLFQRTEYDQRVLLALQRGLPEGAGATVVILAADRNYINSVRGGSFNPSGNVRISSVVGDAVGVFGSVTPLVIRSPADSAGIVLPGCPLP